MQSTMIAMPILIVISYGDHRLFLKQFNPILT
jgi:hypothetical protein